MDCGLQVGGRAGEVIWWGQQVRARVQSHAAAVTSDKDQRSPRPSHTPHFIRWCLTTAPLPVLDLHCGVCLLTASARCCGQCPANQTSGRLKTTPANGVSYTSAESARRGESELDKLWTALLGARCWTARTTEPVTAPRGLPRCRWRHGGDLISRTGLTQQ